MTTANKQTRLDELKARHAAELAEAEAREAICAQLPDSLPLPTISNIRIHEGSTEPVYAWLSYSTDYGTDGKAFALSVFSELEKAGAKPMPVSLCKWDDYRRSTYPAAVEDVPDERPGCFGRKYQLADVEPIAPIWVEPNQYTGVDVRAYYEMSGKVYKVKVKAPLATRLSCRRVEYRGGWRFDGPATLCFPDAWHAIYSGDECVANISQHSRAYRDTEQGLSGAIYWQPLTEQSAFPLSPSQFLAQLFTSTK